MHWSAKAVFATMPLDAVPITVPAATSVVASALSALVSNSVYCALAARVIVAIATRVKNFFIIEIIFLLNNIVN